MSEKILEIKNLYKKYDEKTVLDGISLSLNQGEILGYIGHNGAGKSTTLKSAVGILPIENGEIYIAGHSLKQDIKVCKSITAYVPDNPDIYEYLTGIEYINFISDIYRVPDDIRRKRMLYYSDAFEITDRLGNLISTYSHGMKQKVALISAFVHKPKLLVLDEPFVGLDPKASATLKRVMRELCNEGSGILYSTHVLEVAQILCDKVAMIDHGKIIVQGKVSELTQSKNLEDVFLESLEASNV